MEQILTRKQLLELKNDDSCQKWKDIIDEILLANYYILEDIPIAQKYIDIAQKDCSKNQLILLSKYGLKVGNLDKIEQLDYLLACSILKRGTFTSASFFNAYQYYEHQLATIIEAANYIDNGNKKWILNWADKSQYKYRNWFEYVNGAFRFSGVVVCHSDAYCPVWLHFKNNKSAEIIARTQIELYKKILG